MIKFQINGDLAALEVFGNRVGNVGSNASMRGLSRAIGDELLFQVQTGFSTQTDPYGQPWAKKVIPDGNPPLTGPRRKLRVGWYLKYAGPDAAIIGNRETYAKFQGGTGVFGPSGQPIKPKHKGALSWKGIGGRRFAFKSVRGAPPRLMVPRKGEMPFTWNRAIATAAREYLKERLKGR